MSADSSGRDPPRRGAHPTRWQKGESGNSKGRPRKEPSGASSPSSSAMTELLISEAEREVTLSEGGNAVTMTAGQAVLRATFVSAVKGNAHAQRTFLQMTTTAEMQAAKSRRDKYDNALLIQIHVESERKLWAMQGMAEADMPRHPSDIELNPQTLEVKNFLIYTLDAIEARERLIALRDYSMEKFVETFDVAEEDGDDELLEHAREKAWRMIDALNELLPARFRRVIHRGTPPLSGNDSPEKIWRTWANDDAALFLENARERGGSSPQRRGASRKKGRRGGP